MNSSKSSSQPTKKTYKRETAWLLMLWCVYLSIFGSVAALQAVVWPCFLFLGAAYGMDWASKQTNLVGDSELENREYDK